MIKRAKRRVRYDMKYRKFDTWYNENSIYPNFCTSKPRHIEIGYIESSISRKKRYRKLDISKISMRYFKSISPTNRTQAKRLLVQQRTIPCQHPAQATLLHPPPYNCTLNALMQAWAWRTPSRSDRCCLRWHAAAARKAGRLLCATMCK